ncbi:MAG: hypothetical protein ACLGIB_03155 [Actinomycetota bacterium]
MGLNRWLGDLRETQRNLSELLSENTAEEQAASLEIARSASRFSRRTRQVVDDKLTFSATLMRAGEVSAATRLLAEVEEEVRNEEIALIETVNEVKVAQAVRRSRITRLRLARSMAAAMLGASLLAFSAVGMAVAGALKDRDRAETLAPLRVRDQQGDLRASSAAPLSGSARSLMRRLQIGDINLVLTQKQFRMLKELTGGSVDEQDLTDVVGLLPSALAEKVQDVIDLADSTLETSPEPTLETTPAPVIRKIERAKKKADEAAREETDETGGSEQPADEDSPSPSDEEETSESEEEEGGDSGGNNEGGGSITPLEDGL